MEGNKAMHQKTKIPLGIKIIIGFHLLNIILWTIGQGGAVISYDTVAKWGLQDPRELIDPIIVEVNRAIGLTDVIILIPLFIIAVIGSFFLVPAAAMVTATLMFSSIIFTFNAVSLIAGKCPWPLKLG